MTLIIPFARFWPVDILIINYCISEQLAIANITSIFPLINNTFVIVIFGIQLYIAKVQSNLDIANSRYSEFY